MLDCGEGYTVILQAGVIDENGELVCTTMGMPLKEVESIVRNVLEGDCPVCNGKLKLKTNAS